MVELTNPYHSESSIFKDSVKPSLLIRSKKTCGLRISTASSIACPIRNIRSSLHQGVIIWKLIGSPFTDEYPAGTVIPGTPVMLAREANLKNMNDEGSISTKWEIFILFRMRHHTKYHHTITNYSILMTFWQHNCDYDDKILLKEKRGDRGGTIW